MSNRVRFAEIETAGGYLCGELASALQKEIRRGNEREALFWATELDLAGFGNYVWKRLRIISSEDVGVADSSVALTVRALYENWLEVRKKKDEPEGHARVHLVHAVVLLARAPKSRMLDHVLMVFYGGERERLPIPDYALDMHTRRGRELGRGAESLLRRGSEARQRDARRPVPRGGSGSARAAEAVASKRRAGPARAGLIPAQSVRTTLVPRR